MKLAILGGGNMGGAIALGAIASGEATDSDVKISYPLDYLVEEFNRKGLKGNFLNDNASAIKGAEVVIVAVKPWLVEQVVTEIAPRFNADSQILVSVAAGISLEKLHDYIGQDATVFRVIPNTAISIGKSTTFICHSSNADKQSIEEVVGLFKSMGEVFLVKQEEMAAVTALASCGIAYAFRYIDAAVNGGVELGLDRSRALKIVLQTVKGAVETLKEHGSQPQAEIDKVTTPGGITLKGLEAMENNGFSKAVIEGLKASK